MEPMTRPPAVSQSRRLALVTLDWLPAWMLSTWGATWLATPTFDRLAARGVALDAVMAAGDDMQATLQAVVGPACGLLEQQQIPSSLLVTDATAVSRSADFSCFQDVFEEPASAAEQCQEDEEDTALGQLFLEAEDAVAAMTEDACWLWCHAGSLGTVWDAPLDFRDCLVDEDDPLPPRSAAVPSRVVGPGDDPDLVLGVRQAFAGQVMLADRMLGRLLDAIDQEASQGRPWTVIVAGLRGMPLGLHQQVGVPELGQPVLLPYADLVQMPILVADAAGRMEGQRYGGLLAAEDVGGLCRDLLEGKQQSRLSGLLERWECEPRPRLVSETQRGLAVLTSEWRVVVDQAGRGGQVESTAEDLSPRSPQVFAKPDDFFEQVDVADRCPGVAEEVLAASRGASAADDAPDGC